MRRNMHEVDDREGLTDIVTLALYFLFIDSLENRTMYRVNWHLFVHATLKKLTQQADSTTIYPLHLSKGT